MRLEMDLLIGRFGHEISGEYLTHEEVNRAFDEAIYGPGIFGKMRKLYRSATASFRHDSESQ